MKTFAFKLLTALIALQVAGAAAAQEMKTKSKVSPGDVVVNEVNGQIGVVKKIFDNGQAAIDYTEHRSWNQTAPVRHLAKTTPCYDNICVEDAVVGPGPHGRPGVVAKVFENGWAQVKHPNDGDLVYVFLVKDLTKESSNTALTARTDAL